MKTSNLLVAVCAMFKTQCVYALTISSETVKWQANMIMLCLLFFLSLGSARADAYHPGLTGNDLLPSCSDAVKYFDGDHSNLVASNALFCMGYIDGFIGGSNAMLYQNISLRNKGLRRISCSGESIPVKQWVRILEKYLRDNPQDLNKPARILATVALSKAFPCKD